MNIKEMYKKDQKSLSPPISQMFKNDNSRKEVSRMLSMKIELSKLNRKAANIPIKEKRLGTGAKQSIDKGVYNPIELK